MLLLHDFKTLPPAGSPFPLEATDQTFKCVSITSHAMLKPRSVQTVPFEVRRRNANLTGHVGKRLAMIQQTLLSKVTHLFFGDLSCVVTKQPPNSDSRFMFTEHTKTVGGPVPSILQL